MLAPGRRRVKAIYRRDGPRPVEKIIGKKNHITLGLCIAADATYLPPLIIFPRKTLPQLPPPLHGAFTITGQKKDGWTDPFLRNG